MSSIFGTRTGLPVVVVDGVDVVVVILGDLSSLYWLFLRKGGGGATSNQREQRI